MCESLKEGSGLYRWKWSREVVPKDEMQASVEERYICLSRFCIVVFTILNSLHLFFFLSVYLSSTTRYRNETELAVREGKLWVSWQRDQEEK